MELIDRLRQHDLLTEKQLVELLDCKTELETPEQMAEELVRRGWLTSYQAQHFAKDKLDRLELGGYRLIEPIGSGGMGDVYLARQKKLDRDVALKLIRPEFAAANSDALARFRREALAVARLSHANIVHIYDTDEVDGTHFLVMEFVRGIDLSRLVAERGPLPIAVACDYVRQAALGLQHAFEAGLVHRDIKPSNLLVSLPETPNSGFGLVKILDLGLARLSEEPGDQVVTRVCHVLGTPDFISPEQARDPRQASIHSDLYSLGCTMYFILNGQVPFPDRTGIQKILCHQLERPKSITALRPDVPGDVQTVLGRLMKKEPQDRYQTPSEVASVLSGILSKLKRPVSWPGKAPAKTAESSKPIAPPSKTDHETVFGRQPARPASLAGLQITHLSMVNPVKAPDVSWLGKPASAPSAPPSMPVVPPPATDSHQKKAAPAPAANSPAASIRVIKAATIAEMGSLSTVVSSNAQCTAVLQGHAAPVVTMDFDTHRPVIATGGLDHAVRVWRIDAQNARQEDAFSDPRLGEIRAMLFMPIGTDLLIAASGLGGRVWRWRPGASDEMKALDQSTGAAALAVSSDGKYIAAADGSQVRLWTVAGEMITLRETLRGRGCEITAMTFSRDGELLVAADVRGRVFTWRGGRRSYRPDSTFVAHAGAITSVAISKNDRRLATAGTDNAVRLWSNSSEFEEVATISAGLRGVARRLHFTPDRRMLLTVSDAGQVAGWSSSNGEPIADWRLNQPVSTSFSISGDGARVALGRTDSAVNLYEIPTASAPSSPSVVVCSR
jgi:serine/threonine-protein kinase